MNMKKFILLFFSLAVLAACSSDDDGGNTGPDPIIGTWVLVDASAPLDNQFCFSEDSVITFNENNTGEATFYLKANECAGTENTGNWSKSNSTYTISTPVGDLTGTANFTNNNNRFTFTTTIGVLTFERQ